MTFNCLVNSLRYKENGKCPHTCEDRKCIKKSSFHISGGSLKKHTQMASRHPKCTQDCPGYSELGNLLQQAHLEFGKHKPIRALYVLPAHFTKPHSVEEATKSLCMFPMEYNAQLQDDMQMVEDLEEAASLCCYHDKKNQIIYIQEWVRSLWYKIAYKTNNNNQALAFLTCTQLQIGESKTRNDLELEIQTYNDFESNLLNAASSPIDYNLEQYAEQLQDDYDVVLLCKFLTDENR